MNGQTAVASQKLNILPAAKTKKKTSKALAKKNSFVVPRRTLLKIGAGALVLAIIIGGGFGYTKAYADKIYPKVSVAGIKMSGQNSSNANQIIENKIKELNINGPQIIYNGEIVKPTFGEMGITFNTDEIVSEALNYGHRGNLKTRIEENYTLLTSGYQLELKPQINEEQFDKYLSQLATVVEKEPKNASLEIINGQVELSPAENGRGLDKVKLKEDLTNMINSDETAGQIVLNTSDLKAPIDEADTIEARAQAEKYLAASPITVTFEGSSWAADRGEIGSWISFTENGNFLTATANPNGFIETITNSVDIPTIDREIQDGTGAVLNEGQDGRGTDTLTLTAQIKDALEKGQSGTFALGTFATARGEKIIYPHAQPGRYSGRYIDINLSEQTLYAFEGSTLVNQFLVSTGKRGYATPTGEFNVYNKTASQLMDGPDYYLPNVPWISWFSGEYSIHGTYWHSNFGTPMSHGCVNASIPDAEWLYNWDEVGTPVYIHY